MIIFIIALAVLVVALCLWGVVLAIALRKAKHRADIAEEGHALATLALLQAGTEFKKREKVLRADAIKRSKAVVKGNVAEQLVPFTEAFMYNPRDARFLGAPVDLIVFEGMTERFIDRIVFIEVKTGRSSLSKRERQIRDAIDLGEVYWEEIRL